jgi:hypothetical protein
MSKDCDLMEKQQGDRLSKAGSVLVALGVAVWGLYAVLRWGLGYEVTGRQFLPYHLAGVIPGMTLRRWHWLRSLFGKALTREKAEDISGDKGV